MSNEDVLKNIKEIGVKKGYRLDCPEDWYGGITYKEWQKYTGTIYEKTITKNDAIRQLFPNYNFLEWKFKIVSGGWWDDFENLKLVLLPECEKLGRMLNFNEIYKIKNLHSAVNKHGGIAKVANILGFDTCNKYITLSHDITNSMYEVVFSNFCYLNNIEYKYECKILKNRKYTCDFKIKDFYIEIWGMDFFAKYNKVKKIKEQIYQQNQLKLISLNSDVFRNNNINYTNDQLIEFMKLNNIKLDNFYNGDLNYLIKFDSFNKNTAINMIKKECLDKGFSVFPTRKYWLNSEVKKSFHSLLWIKFNIKELAKICNLPTTTKSRGYWKDIDNVKNEINKIYKEIGYIPNYRYLESNNHHGLVYGIKKHHGGLISVKKQLNLI